MNVHLNKNVNLDSTTKSSAKGGRARIASIDVTRIRHLAGWIYSGELKGDRRERILRSYCRCGRLKEIVIVETALIFASDI